MAEKVVSLHKNRQSGQSLVEYSLIVTLVIFSFALALAATGPAIGNVFCNTVYNLVSRDQNFTVEYYNPGTGCVADGVSIASVPEMEQFWATVTWVATQTPQAAAFSTNTPAPPTQTATPGPSPTASPVTPTKTFTPTHTPSPTATVSDFNHVLPWSDSANELIYWRLDENFSMGSEDWYGLYYPNTTLSGDPDHRYYNNQIDPSFRGQINFDWLGGGPIANWPAANPGNNWSVSWRRPLYLTEKTTLTFSVPAINDGIRIWIMGGAYGGNPSVLNGGPENCSSTGVRSGGGATGSWNVYDDSRYGYNPGTSPDTAIPSECLLFDRWRNGSDSVNTFQRTIPAGYYTVQIDMFEGSGDAAISVDIGSVSTQINPDDTRVDGGGNVVGGQASCNWDHWDTKRSNSLDYTWDEYRNGQLPPANRCHLELRGSVMVPTGTVNPALTFWDAWDLQPGARAYLEIADYDPNNDGAFNRGDLSWTRVQLHQDNTYNYNWTYQTVDLSSYVGRKVTFRFVIENRTSSANNKWYIDTIRVDSVQRPTLYPAQEWNLNDMAQADDFITTGHWELTNEFIVGGDGMSWHESPNRNYSRFYEARDGGYELTNVRAHSIEFGGFIRLNDPRGTLDLEGDSGEPLLTFWHQYDLGRRTGLEVQYTTDPYSAGDGANWQPVPGGTFVPRNNGSNIANNMMEFIEIPLNSIGQNEFRLRFAMLVHKDASEDDGWWIDEIKLERRGLPKFTAFPFIDEVENPDGLDDWLAGGSWGRVPEGRRPAEGQVGYAYTESPSGDFQQNINTTFELRYPMDLYLDTPVNKNSPDCNLGALCEAPGTAPVDPIMTFYHTREFNSGGENFYVEWKRASEDNSQWQVLWAYLDQMRTNGTGNYSETRNQIAWERVEIDLRPMMAAINASNSNPDKTDDDVVIRFRLQTNGNNTGDGLLLDDIRIEERQERYYRLWGAGTQAQDSDGRTIRDENNQPILGDGDEFYDGLDNNPDLFAGAYHFGGDWSVVNWQQRGGLYAFHDSPIGGQNMAPPYTDGRKVDDHATPHDTFNVLEMATIIDMRGIDADTQPILYFWSRYAIGNDDYARVQISYRDDTFINSPLCRSGYKQCYEKQYGWSEWETVWEVHDDVRTYTWQREQISLAPYARQTTRDGRLIRIRFVVDAYERDDNWDGWYIDEISIEKYDPRVFTISKPSLGGQAFFDAARNMTNWLGEGTWGLDPVFYRGAGGGPASLGSAAWTYYYWNLGRGNGTECGWSDFRTCAGNFLDGNPTSLNPDAQGLVLEIDNNWGRSGPMIGGNRVTDYFTGRWELTTGQVGVALNPGTYTFITASDDGVRLKYDTVPPGNLPAMDPAEFPLAGEEWNMINNWTYHGRTIDQGLARLDTGNRYKFTLEWFEGSSDAVIQLTTGSTKFSFTDSPAAGPDPDQDMFAIPRSNSSLVLDGVFDLTDTEAPFIQYYTVHELQDSTARVEVTTDGGFTWTDAGLEGDLPNKYFTGSWTGRYWNRKDGPGTAGTAITAQQNPSQLEFWWGGSSPQNGVDNDFSSEWRRTLRLTEPMTVKIYTRSDDGHRVFMNGNQIAENWRNGGWNTSEWTGFLAPGDYEIVVAHYDQGGGAHLATYIRGGGFDSPSYTSYSTNYSGTVTIPPPWTERIHDLSMYAGFPAVGLRFRLDRLNAKSADEGSDYQQRTQNPINWYESWWITDITVADQSS